MLKIWGRRNSSNVRKVLWCAEEIGAPYESIEVGGATDGTFSGSRSAVPSVARSRRNTAR